MKRLPINASVLLALGLSLTLALLWLLTMPLPARADPDILYVATDGSDANDCSTIANRCRTVQRAVALAATGDEIWVAGGVYTDTDTASLGYVVALIETVTLRGGWNASFTTQNFAGTPTTLDAERAGRVIYVNGNITPTIEGLIMARGDATGQGGRGGGLYSQGASLIVRHSVITDNVASSSIGFGGGFCIVDATAVLTDTQVVSNVASAASYGWGGGLYLDSSTATLTDTQVMSNTASMGYDGYGGGFSLDSAVVNLDGATGVSGNIASTEGYGYGGGLYLSNSSMTALAGTQVMNNIASTAASNNGYGGGLYLSGSTASLSSATVVRGNTSSTAYYGYGGGLYLEEASTVTLTDTQVVSNTASTGEEACGGGFYLSDSMASLSGATLVQGNTASTVRGAFGGGLYLSSSTASLNGATIVQGNTASAGSEGFGGGLYLRDYSTATLTDTQVMSNTASAAHYGYGGGLYLDDSMANLSGATVVQGNIASTSTGNHRGYGGGLYLVWSIVNLSDTTAVQGNTASVASIGYGGGLYLLDDSTANLSGATAVQGNMASTAGTGYGGGLYLRRSTSTANLNSTQMVNNTASAAGAGYGGGLYAAGGSTMAVNSVIAHNAREGLYLDGGNHSFANSTLSDNSLTGARVNGGTLILTNTIVARHDVGINQTAGTVIAGYTLFYNTVNILGSVTNTNPVYSDPRFVDAAAGDYHLQMNSTAIDQGDPAGTTAAGGPAPTTDFDGEGRPVGTRVDIGADEFLAVLSVTKQTDPDPVPAGAHLTYTLRITNTSHVTLHATVTDTLPTQVTPTGTLAWTTGAIAPGSVWTQTVVVTVEAGYAGTLTNVVQVMTTEGATGVYTATSLSLAPHLEVTKQADPTPAPSGTPLTYTLRVTNTGNVLLTATITDVLPAHVTPTGVLTWTTVITASGDIWTETVVVTVEMGYTGPLTNLVQVTTDEGATGTYTRTVIAVPMVDFGSATYNVGESAGTATITVTLDTASYLTATVDYATSDGTATVGSDYITASGTLTFAPGATALTFTVPVTDDTRYENDETVNLALSNPLSAALGSPSAATLTIADDDNPPTVAFSSATYSVDEDAGPAVITVTLTGAAALTATVDYDIGDPLPGSGQAPSADPGQAPATAGDDYTAASGALTFTPGTTALTFTVPIADDTLDENDETVNLALSSPTSATLGTPYTATLTIVDNDPPPTVQFSSATYRVDENAETATVTATLNVTSGLTVTVGYATSDPSAGSEQAPATAGSDYITASGTLTFAPGTTALTFTVPITDDNLCEYDETVNLALSDPVNATLGTFSATLIITDDDTAIVSIAKGNNGEEPNSDGQFIIFLTRQVAALVTVTYSIGGTATNGTDYTALPGSAAIPANTISTTIIVNVVDDDWIEGDETVQLALIGTSDSRVIVDPVNGEATLTILDDDELFCIHLPLVMRNYPWSSRLTNGRDIGPRGERVHSDAPLYVTRAAASYDAPSAGETHSRKMRHSHLRD